MFRSICTKLLELVYPWGALWIQAHLCGLLTGNEAYLLKLTSCHIGYDIDRDKVIYTTEHRQDIYSCIPFAVQRSHARGVEWNMGPGECLRDRKNNIFLCGCAVTDLSPKRVFQVCYNLVTI